MMANPHFDIIDISNSAAFNVVRYDGADFINKAGILPYYREGEETHYLFASPKPVRHPGDLVPFAMARGTRRMKKDGEWVDIRNDGMIDKAKSGLYEVEPLWKTALCEGEEELGLEPKHVHVLHDCGVLSYKGYGIRFFAADVKECVPLIDAIDSHEVKWLTKNNVRLMIEDMSFNGRYESLFSAIDSAIAAYT